MTMPPRQLAVALLLTLLGAACRPAAAPAQATPQPRVVTLAPHLTELVCAAAGCEALVAVSAYSDYPPAVRQKPQIGDAAQLNIEALMALRPTQVIVWEGGTPAAQLAKLQSAGLPVTRIKVERLDDVADALLQLGRVLGSSARATAAAEDYRQRLERLKAAHRQSAPLRVLYQIQTGPVYSINHASPISEAIRLCGGSNVFADLPTLAAPVSDEAVLATRPQLVVYGPEDAAKVEAYWARFAGAGGAPPALVGIDPDLLARAGPRLVQGVEALCAALDATRGRLPR